MLAQMGSVFHGAPLPLQEKYADLSIHHSGILEGSQLIGTVHQKI